MSDRRRDTPEDSFHEQINRHITIQAQDKQNDEWKF